MIYPLNKLPPILFHCFTLIRLIRSQSILFLFSLINKEENGGEKIEEWK